MKNQTTVGTKVLVKTGKITEEIALSQVSSTCKTAAWLRRRITWLRRRINVKKSK